MFNFVSPFTYLKLSSFSKTGGWGKEEEEEEGEGEGMTYFLRLGNNIIDKDPYAF